MSTIKLRRSDSSGQPPNGALKKGEVAYSYYNQAGGSKLYIGSGDLQADPAVAIGGQFYTAMLDHTPGALTGSSAIITDANSKLNQIILGGASASDTSVDLVLTNRTLAVPANIAGVNDNPDTPGFTISGGDISLTNQRITGLATPTNNNDAVTKAYVDTAASGLNVKDANDGLVGNIASGENLTVLGSDGATTTFVDANNTLTIGLSQSIETDSEIEFKSVTIGENENKIKISDDTIEQVTPQIYVQTGAPDYATGVFTITDNGFANLDAVTYVASDPSAKLAELTDGATYYIVSVDVATHTFKLATNSDGSGAIVSYTGATGSGDDILKTASNPVALLATSDSVTIGSATNSTVAIQNNLTVGGSTIIAGNLTVNGTSTTVNSTIVQVDDPVMELGEGTNDSFDRGIKFHYYDNTAEAATLGFMGFDKSESKFTLLSAATEDSTGSQTFTGTKGLLVADIEGDATGNAGTASAFDGDRTITIEGDVVSVVNTANEGESPVYAESGVTWDGSGALTIRTELKDTVSALLGDYTLRVQADPLTPITVANVQTDSDGDNLPDTEAAIFQVGVGVAGTRATSYADTPVTAQDPSNLGVASFSSTAFTVTNGWVDLNIVDGGEYGT